MEKFDYSDLYKFLVSVGITLIALSILLPWLYLKEPFDLNVKQEELKLLTAQGQAIIKNRQQLVATYYTFIPKVAIGLAIAGLISIVYGIAKWFPKQKNLDKRDITSTLIAQKELEQMGSAEIKEKNEKEFKQAEILNATSSNQPIVKEEFLSSYLQIEQIFNSKITAFYQNQYTVLTNIRSGRDEYDLILTTDLKEQSDFVFEFKYFKNHVTHYELGKLLFPLNTKLLHYANAVKLKVAMILMVVLNNEDYEKLLPSKPLLVGEAKMLYSLDLKIEYVTEKDFDCLNKTYFDKVLFG
jgi:hypothetical protein